MPPFVTQNYLVATLLLPLVVTLLGSIAVAIITKRGGSRHVIGLIAGLIAFMGLYFLFPPPPGPGNGLIRRRSQLPNLFGSDSQRSGRPVARPDCGEGRRWVEEMRERNKFTAVSTNKKTGRNAAPG